jgi:8-oxo-dGTP diphosphatase
MIEATLCEIIKDGKLLLKKATRGVGEGKWNGLGGKMDPGESDVACAVREVKEESNLDVSGLRKHGVLRFYDLSKENLFFTVHLFSTSECEGEMRECDEGELKWFELESLPYDKMWADDEIWMPLLLQGKDFDGDFVFDGGRRNIVEHEIRLR